MPKKPPLPCFFICDEKGKLLFANLPDTSRVEPLVAGVHAFLERGETKDTALHTEGGLVEVRHVNAPEFSGFVCMTLPLQEDADRVQALIRENRELMAVYETCDQGIVIADASGRYISCNETYGRMTGLAWHDIVGRNAQEMISLGLVTHASAPAVLATRQIQLTSQKFHTGISTSIRGVPVLDKDGEVWRAIAFVKDITELENIRNELKNSQEKLNSLQQESQDLRKYPVLFSGPTMRPVYEKACKFAGVDTSLLILGETGVGKEVVTDLVHSLSPRRNKPFLKINCAAIPENLLETELFGYEGGAFTDARREGKPGLLEAADKGTLLLDEVDALPWGMQTKLLRFLQMQEFYRVGGKKLMRVNVRLIAASNQDLETLVAEQRFRPDFYYRLNVLQIIVPPLRERREDIVPLAHISLDRFNALHGTEKSISPATYRYLLAYDWPGNIRELENIIERMVVEHGADLLTPDALPAKIRQALVEGSGHIESSSDYRQERDKFEKMFWAGVFSRYRTTREAARATNVAHSTVVKKFARYNIRGTASAEAIP